MQALDSLLNTLADEGQALPIARLYSLSGLDKKELEHVRAAWPSIPAERRRVVMRHLVDISEANFEVDFGPMFRIGLSDDEPAVRAAAIDGLWEEENASLVPTLIDFLHNDAAESVRAAAAISLGHYVLAGELEDIPAARLEEVVESLRATIEDDNETLDVRRRAIEAIGYSGAEGVSDLITEAYSDAEEAMRISAVFAMGRSADLQWADLLLHETESANPEMRFEAARACGELQNPAAVPTLTRLVEDVDDQVREAAVWSLGQIGGAEARRVLIEILEGQDAELREVANAALEELEFMSGLDLDFTLFDFQGDDPYSERDD